MSEIQQISSDELRKTIEALDFLINDSGRTSFSRTMEGADQIAAHYKDKGFYVSTKGEEVVILSY